MNNAIAIIDDCRELRRLVSLLVKETLGVPCVALGSFLEVTENSAVLLECKAVIIDINLGSGQPDGVAVYEWLKEHGYSGQMFFFTGHAKESPAVKGALKTGVTLLEKPMDPARLIAFLKSGLVDSLELAHG